jgi:hypothetical protein
LPRLARISYRERDQNRETALFDTVLIRSCPIVIVSIVLAAMQQVSMSGGQDPFICEQGVTFTPQSVSETYKLLRLSGPAGRCSRAITVDGAAQVS